MLTCNLFQHTCFSCLKSTFFILSYQLHCCWLDDPHRFPGPTHSTGGRGVDVMTMTMAGGVGGGPGTWNIYTCVPFGCGFKRHHLFWQPFGFGCLKTLVGDVISGTCITKNSDDGLQTVCLHMLLFFFNFTTTTF